jgi:hypothetical protein
MESGHLAQASLRQGKLSGWLERGVAAAVRLWRYRQRAAMQPRQAGPHAAGALATPSPCRRPSRVIVRTSWVARARASFSGWLESAALRPSRGSLDAGLPRRRRRCKPDRAMRPCCPAAALTAPQTRHVATMGVVDRLPSVLACGRCAGSATPARGCGCGCFRLRERIRPSGPSMPPLASLPPPRSLLERHACEAVASTVVSRVPCSRLGAGFRAPAPINFFFLERLFRFFLHPPTPLKIKGGTWNMEQSRSPPTAGPGRQPPAEPPTYRRPSRQPEGGGCCQRPTQRPNGQRPTANGQVGGVARKRSPSQRHLLPRAGHKASLPLGYLCRVRRWPPPSLHAPPEWRHRKCP